MQAGAQFKGSGAAGNATSAALGTVSKVSGVRDALARGGEGDPPGERERLRGASAQQPHPSAKAHGIGPTPCNVCKRAGAKAQRFH